VGGRAMKRVTVLYLIIGFLLGICVMFVVGANTSTSLGRYQITVEYTDSNDFFITILDSHTGKARAWNRKVGGGAEFDFQNYSTVSTWKTEYKPIEEK
jgi:hypothetical protein